MHNITERTQYADNTHLFLENLVIGFPDKDVSEDKGLVPWEGARASFRTTK
jgi:hypothetical protein